MDIFKLFFNHDQRLDKLAKRNANKTKEEVEASLEDFMNPDPTYSKFYFTGTKLKEEQFGLNILDHYEHIITNLEEVFAGHAFITAQQGFDSFKSAVAHSDIGDAIIITDNELKGNLNISALHVDTESNVGHFKEELSNVLKAGYKVLYKEQAHNGFDLHLFSKENIYRKMFYPLKEMITKSDNIRFFSINSKRMQSEKHFYFETWTLERPPHGAEEVLPETVL